MKKRKEQRKKDSRATGSFNQAKQSISPSLQVISKFIPAILVFAHSHLFLLGNGVRLRPFPRGLNGSGLVLLPCLRNFWCKWIVWVRRAEQSLNRE